MAGNPLRYFERFPYLAWVWRLKMGNGKTLEKPAVEIGSSGVSRVKPADIIRSRVGQEEISKTAAIAVALKLRKPESVRSQD
jgi:hypothetical protein